MASKALAALAGFAGLGACSQSDNPMPNPTPDLAPSIQAGQWVMKFSPGASSTGFRVNTTGGFYFNFPVHADGPGCNTTSDQTAACPAIHYVTRPWGKAATQVHMTAFVKLAPGASFAFHTQSQNTGCPTPAHVRFLLQVANDNLTTPTWRWWSNPMAIDLPKAAASEAPVTLSVPITPDQWSDVNGQLGTAQPAAFAVVTSVPAIVGMTFGGGCFFGHGVYAVGGGASFEAQSFTLD
jgi:hypothetical protein